ncbi:endonuclease/exonuclease/phosphatase family protein [Breoghania corrubedonensis]|uniref:Endonuclease/exonuclease/phosphatase family protein n=1 Tax=Breoghania corrubedonensis TaxID=665038 RepID=A0A2T5VAT6_9HYPH|nr:endonuclease/exonuclease/phosphatase family protein [Breoghania corrubedonensis]PTW60863.1 endonuclease/exonuclease/phosphatase family protein [Breoghania corrubedonensis]
MEIKIGTFNLNNLFSRFNFAGAVDSPPSASEGGITLTFDEGSVKVRTFMGRLVKEKDPEETVTIARRIRQAMDVDVLGVQEVEHIEILKQFNRDYLGGGYDEIALIEGNDPRLIDVGLLSRLPVGAITSFQTSVHPDDPARRVFGRDLVRIEILGPDRQPLLVVYNTHMKSHYVPFHMDPVAGAAEANERRRRQAETIGAIIAATEGPDSRFVLLGDMNDPPGSPFLAPMIAFAGGTLVNSLADARETRPAKPETPGQGPGPASVNWTHRYNPPGPEFPHYEQYDQIWLSPALAPHLAAAFIDRRTRHGGDGSDHDPAWVVLDL